MGVSGVLCKYPLCIKYQEYVLSISYRFTEMPVKAMDYSAGDTKVGAFHISIGIK